MATVIGEAGVGKSRLIREFVASAEGSAQVVRGRCLPYGEGITFWPFVEIARGAAEIRDEDAPDVARTKLLALVGERDVAVRIASVAGLTPAQFPVADLVWGARRFMEILAASRPLVVVIDDIHWAEPTVLELLEHLLDNVAEAPVLLLCSSRHDLLEEHPDWSERPRATRLVLEPLSEADAAQVVENLLGNAGLPEEVRARIVAAAEGNPLFVEQMPRCSSTRARCASTRIAGSGPTRARRSPSRRRSRRSRLAPRPASIARSAPSSSRRR
jgi:predicted ATPase